MDVRCVEVKDVLRARDARVARQREILASLGKPEDWLQDKPDCPLCGDHGYVGTQKCRCLIKALEEQGATV